MHAPSISEECISTSSQTSSKITWLSHDQNSRAPNAARPGSAQAVRRAPRARLRVRPGPNGSLKADTTNFQFERRRAPQGAEARAVAYRQRLSNTGRPRGGTAAGTRDRLGNIGATRRQRPCWAAWTAMGPRRMFATAPDPPRDGSGGGPRRLHVIHIT